MTDIQQLYEDAMTALSDPRGIHPALKDLLDGYCMGIRDVMREHGNITTRFDNSSMYGIGPFVIEIWRNPEGIIEDEVSRLCFRLLCQKIIDCYTLKYY